MICDVGCHTGGLTHAFGKAGIKAMGFDVCPQTIEAANLISTMPDIGSANASFELIEGELRIPECSAVVCLSLLNHHMEVPARHEEGFKIFRKCVDAAPVVILDAPSPGEPVGGFSEYIDSEAVFKWCKDSGANGVGTVLAERSDDLQRTLLIWQRT